MYEFVQGHIIRKPLPKNPIIFFSPTINRETCAPVQFIQSDKIKETIRKPVPANSSHYKEDKSQAVVSLKCRLQHVNFP